MSDDRWRIRLGVLTPSANTVLERDAQMMLPSSVTAHFARMKLEQDDEQQLWTLKSYAPEAAALLADAGVDAIAFGCTTGSLMGGLGYDKEIVTAIEEAAQVPATTTATALVEALAELRVRTVNLVSPYDAALNEKVVAFLRANGVDVDDVFGFDIPNPREIAAVSPDEIANAVRRIDSPRVDAAIISCTTFRGVEATRLIDDVLGKPVISSNQATFWKLGRIVEQELGSSAGDGTPSIWSEI